jgi:outer membrane protein assembly factor BamB
MRMPRDPQNFIFVGVKNSVVALDDKSGTEVWHAKLRSSDFVNVLWDGEALIAANSGEVWRLDPKSGAVIWHNGLKGLGRGLISLASTRRPISSTDADLLSEKRRREQGAAPATAAAG